MGPLDPLEALKLIAPALTDPWYLVDDQDQVLQYNAAFYSLLPRRTARKLNSLGCRDALTLQTCCGDSCLRKRCIQEGPLQLHDLEATVGGEKLRVIVSAIPVALAPDRVGALIVLRDVTSEARVQDHYRAYVRDAERARHELEAKLDERTRELLAANDELNRLEETLARLKRGGS